MYYERLHHPISTVKIDRTVMLEAMSVAEFSKGGFFPNYKTKRSSKKYIQRVFGSNDPGNYVPDKLIFN